MYKWINKQGVEKVGEFVLQRTDRFHYEYRERELKLSIVTENNGACEALYLCDATRTFREQECKRIEDNIVGAMKFMGIRFRIC